VSGITTTSGGASNTMAGGREIPIFISTLAIAGIGMTIKNVKKIIPKSNFFTLLPPCLAFIKNLPFAQLRCRCVYS
jgi:hypothetical protein